MPLSLLRPSALRRFDHYVLALMATLATGGCAGTVRTPYVPPTLPVAPAWPESAAAPSAPAGRIAWWREAGDAALIRLVERVIAANPNLAAAGIRLHQARLSASLAARQLTPALGANLSGDRRIPLSGAPGTEASGIALTASWEADLFGKLDAQRDAARWEAAATAADLAATRQSLIATTATAWFQLALANERLANGAASIGAAQHTLTLVHTQHRAGAVSSLELRDSEQALAAQQAAQAGFAQARSEARNALAALLGQHGYDGPEPQALPDTAPPPVSAGLPAEILGSRPDLAAAELRLRRTLALGNAQRAALYPQLTLTGSLGTASTALLNVLRAPTAGLSALLSIPLLNPDRIRRTNAIARDEFAIAVALFRQRFYDALRDTGNALSSRAMLVEQGIAIARSHDAAVAAERLYERQYRAGAVSLRSWIDAQERRRNARNALIQNRFDQWNAQIAVHLALGDGDPAAITVP